MKRYLLLFALLTFIPVPLIPEAVIAEETQLVASEIDPELKAYARSISVKITSSNKDRASGVLIGQQDDQYLVITNHHVIQDGSSFTIQTEDGTNHQASIVDNPITSDDDIALLTFNSDNNYQPVKLNSADAGNEQKKIYAVGYAADTGEFTVEPGTIERITDQPLVEGYRIGYTNNVVPGMSGGAIFDELGDLVGINGISAFPILNTVYQYEDGTTPTSAEIEEFRSLSWGLSLHRLLTQLNPEIMKAYSLPLPETVADIGNTVLTGWLADLETKAKQITVRIDSSSGANGSGIIIAQSGTTYTVLTANHVLCEQDQKIQDECIDYAYKIVTPDGTKYPLDKETINAEEGVDLAVFQFTSEETYQLAELANYPLRDNDAVFVAGYPQLGKNTPAQWGFSLGYGLEKETGLLSVNARDNSNSSESSNSANSQGSLAGGYEMVYTSITYGGMSGGAVLDREGRVIGIHGLAEGETAIDSQSGSSTSIQLGYSLGVPTSTLVGIANRLQIDSQLLIQDRKPKALNPAEIEALETAILGTEISQGNATPERWLERGNQLWRLRRYDEAATAFEQAKTIDSEFIHLAHYGEGLALFYQGKNELALASLQQAINSNSEFAPAFDTKSSVLRQLDRLEDALIAIDRAIALEPQNANWYSTKGTILSDLNRYSDAEVAYSDAIDLDSRAAFYFNRGLLYSNQEKLELALADYNQAIQINPQYLNAYVNRGLLYDNQGKVELALADYNQAIQINPQLAEAYYNRGLLYHNQGEVELALADYNQAIQINPQFANAYVNRGLLYSNQGKVELALADYNQAIQINPQDPPAYSNRGLLYSNQGKVELALADYNQAIEINPQDPDIYYNRGLLYSNQGKVELALTDYNQAIEINPQFALAYANLGLLYKDSGDVQSAQTNLQKAQQLFLAQGETTKAEQTANFLRELEHTPEEVAANTNHNESTNSGETHLSRGIVYAQQEESDLAINEFTQAIQLDPNNITAYELRAFLYASQEKKDLAMADFNRAIDLGSNDADVYTIRGLIFSGQDKPDLALADFTKTIELNPDNTEAYIYRGDLYNEQNKLDLALADYNQAIKLDRNNPDMYINRGFVYHKLQDFDLALSDYEQALSLDNNNVVAINNIGFIKYEIDDIAEARQLFEQAISLNNEFAEPQLALAVTLFTSGETEQALSIAEAALELDQKFADPEYLKENLWGDKIIADAKKLLSHPQVQAFLGEK